MDDPSVRIRAASLAAILWIGSTGCRSDDDAKAGDIDSNVQSDTAASTDSGESESGSDSGPSATCPDGDLSTTSVALLGAIGGAYTDWIVVWNHCTGGDDLVLSGNVLSGDGAWVYSIDSASFPLAVAPGEQGSFQVGCDIPGEGPYEALLTLATNDPESATWAVALYCGTSL